MKFVLTYTIMLLNMSLQVSTASTLFEGKVDEQLVMQRTGHRTTTAVRMYKRASTGVQQEVSDLLQPPPPKGVKLSEHSESHVHLSSDDSDGNGETKKERPNIGRDRENIFDSMVKLTPPKPVVKDTVNSMGATDAPMTITICKGGSNVQITL